jgi:hypothetical protein
MIGVIAETELFNDDKTKFVKKVGIIIDEDIEYFDDDERYIWLIMYSVDDQEWVEEDYVKILEDESEDEAN